MIPLVPCKPNQFRNPKTNRCKKIPTEKVSKKVSKKVRTLKECKPGQIRNPQTNRCRKITSELKPTERVPRTDADPKPVDIIDIPDNTKEVINTKKSFTLTEDSGDYKNKNLLNATIIKKDNELSCRFYFGKDYKKTFGDQLFVQFNNERFNKPAIEVSITIDRNSSMSGLIKKENDDVFNKNSQEYDKDSIFIPASKETPLNYHYRLAGFYVLVKDKLQTEKEKQYFRGIGHALLCWILSESNLGQNNILALEASGSGDQEKLVQYYTTLGFRTCANLSNVPKSYYKSATASAVCMYSTIGNVNSVCSLKKRSFNSKENKSKSKNPFKYFRNN